MILAFAIYFQKIKMPNSKQHRCSKCGAFFSCDFQIGKERCRCQNFFRVMPMKNIDEGCICPQCLSEAIFEKQGEQITIPSFRPNLP